MKVVGAVFYVPSWQLPAAAMERLRREMPHLDVVHATNAESLASEIVDADAALMTRISPADFLRARRLRYIHSAAAGVGGLLFKEIQASEVILTNSRGIHGTTMAEHVVGVSIALLRGFPEAVRDQAAHRWQYLELTSVRVLSGRHMVIVGLGGVGAAVARAAAALGVRVSGVRRHPEAPVPEGVREVVGPAGLRALLPEADILVLAAPLTADTRALIGASELRLMKPTAILVNVARGKLVNEAELTDSLARGVIGGAALDVFEHEPLDPGSRLWDMPNVLITPHTSGYREDYWDAVVDLFIENLRRFESGQPLLNVVDKTAGY